MRVTIRDIARMTGTSPAAVSFVLNNRDEKRVAPAKREAILEAVRATGYRRNPAAAGLVLGRHFRMGLCIHGLFHQYPILGNVSHYEALSCLTQRLHSAHYGIDLMQLDREMPPQALAERLAAEMVDGCVLLNWHPTAAEPVARALKTIGKPCVAMGARLPDDLDWAAIDREGAIHEATSVLLKEGLRRVVLLDCTIGIASKTFRTGYERAMREQGLDPLATVRASGLDMDSVTAAVRELLRETPGVEGILLSENFSGPMALTALAGRRVRILGYGESYFADLCRPRLSHLKLPVEKLAEFSARNLLAQIEDPNAPRVRNALIRCDLVMRET